MLIRFFVLFFSSHGKDDRDTPASDGRSEKDEVVLCAMRGMSIERAHKLLHLTPQRALRREDIEHAYRSAAKRYHPDSRFIDSRPCAIKYIDCQDARHALIKYYYSNPSITMRRARRRQTAAPPELSPALRHLKYKKYTMGVKFMVLIMVACDGVLESLRSDKRDPGT